MVNNLSDFIQEKYGFVVFPEDIKEGKNGYYIAKIKDGYILAKPRNKYGTWKFLIAKA